MTIEMPNAACLPGLRALWKEAFGDTDGFLDAFFCTAFNPRRCRCVLAEGQVAAALYWFDCLVDDRKVAYIYAVATAKAYRGQGLCHQLMERTHRELAQLGYSGAVLVPGEECLFQFYEAMGYTVCGFMDTLACSAADVPTDLREVDADEYACLRKSFLPAGGVVQEGENLAFLQTQARLYAAEGFVLAAQRDKDTLWGMELLGEPGAAPKILRALGCTRGRFRHPGERKPFAMYYPLDGTPSPVYFGLAFD